MQACAIHVYMRTCCLYIVAPAQAMQSAARAVPYVVRLCYDTYTLVVVGRAHELHALLHTYVRGYLLTRYAYLQLIRVRTDCMPDSRAARSCQVDTHVYA